MVKDPDLLLVDEPVAVMTDAETARTAAPSCDVARTGSIVVAHHGLECVKHLDVPETVLHHGPVPAKHGLHRIPSSPKAINVHPGHREGPLSMPQRDRIFLKYGTGQALRSVSQTADPGAAACSPGSNGAGQTNLLDAIAGLLKASKSRITSGTRDVARAPATRPGIRLPDDPTEGIRPSIIARVRHVVTAVRAGGTRTIIPVMDRGAAVQELRPAGLAEAAVRRHLPA